MSYLIPGVFLYSDDDLPYEAEECYFLDYQILSTLVSIEYLLKPHYDSNMPFKSKYVYYHFYTDHLLFSWGQICSRFIINNSDNKDERERKQSCSHNFQFDEIKYPILSDKKARNTIEHLDEYNHYLIQIYDGVGGFNLIDSSESEELIDYLRKNRQTHPYTLDLLKNQLYIQRKEGELTIDLIALKIELEQLQRSVWDYKSIVDEKAKNPNWPIKTES